MNYLKSAGAVFAGFLTVIILSLGTDTVLELAGIFPQISLDVPMTTWMLAFALLYRTIYTVLGGYVTARLAPQNPMKLVWILAGLGLLGGILGVKVGWNLSAHWYPIALAVLAMPSVWLGGWIRMRKEKQVISASAF